MTQEFSTAIDIANRACQHMGARRIVAFTDDSVQAVEIGGCYDQLRRAELERNVWVFATRRVILRPLDTNTMLLTPEQWSSTKNYFNGAIVDDGTGTVGPVPSPAGHGGVLRALPRMRRRRPDLRDNRSGPAVLRRAHLPQAWDPAVAKARKPLRIARPTHQFDGHTGNPNSRHFKKITPA